MDSIGEVRRGTDKTAAELALARLPAEIAQLSQKRTQLKVYYDGKIKEKKDILTVVGVIAGAVCGAVASVLITSIGKFFFANPGPYAVLSFFFVGAGVLLLTKQYLKGIFSYERFENEKKSSIAALDAEIEKLEARRAENYRIATPTPFQGERHVPS